MKELFKQLKVESKKGKEHSLKYEELDPDFAKWLRENYYNIDLNTQDVFELRKIFLNR